MGVTQRWPSLMPSMHSYFLLKRVLANDNALHFSTVSHFNHIIFQIHQLLVFLLNPFPYL